MLIMEQIDPYYNMNLAIPVSTGFVTEVSNAAQSGVWGKE
jgi:hypothetical protein